MMILNSKQGDVEMDEKTKISWLERVLLFKVLVSVFFWGLPVWLAPASVLNFFSIEMPVDPLFMRMFGAAMVGLGVLYWLALQNPVKNRDIIRYAVIENALAFITIVVVAATTGISAPTVWVSMILVAFFAAAFYYLTPKAA
jgi:hypothetical protein